MSIQNTLCLCGMGFKGQRENSEVKLKGLIALWEVGVYDFGTLGTDASLSLSRWEECEESTRGVKGILSLNRHFATFRETVVIYCLSLSLLNTIKYMTYLL